MQGTALMENTAGTTVTHPVPKALGTVPSSDEAVPGGTDLSVHPCLGLGMQPDPASCNDSGNSACPGCHQHSPATAPVRG